MKLVILDRSTLGTDIDLNCFDQFGEVTSYDVTYPEETLERIKNQDIIITNKVVITKEMMEQSDIKLICITATGTNNVDLEAAKAFNIPVKNVAGYSTHSVAQVAFAMIFKLIQKLDYYTDYVNKGNWEKSPIFTNIDQPFFELAGKRVGIIGLGDIGSNVAKIATGFSCEVVYHSTSGANNNQPYTQVSLDELLSTSDIISIHCPLNEKTQDLLNSSNMQQMKDGAILLNLGRGGIINEADLAEVIDTKEIYCGIDVVSKEPIEGNNPLRAVKHKERLLLTPHIGWASIEARTTLIKGVCNNIKTFIESN